MGFADVRVRYIFSINVNLCMMVRTFKVGDRRNKNIIWWMLLDEFHEFLILTRMKSGYIVKQE